MDNYRSMFESRISAGATEKLSVLSKLDASISTLVLGRGRSCQEMCGKILRTGEKNEAAIIQSSTKPPDGLRTQSLAKKLGLRILDTNSRLRNGDH